MRDAAINDDGLVDALIDGVGHALDLRQHTARNDARGLVTLDLGDLDLGDERRLVVLIVEQADNIRHADELFGVQGNGDLRCGSVGVDVVGDAVFVHADVAMTGIKLSASRWSISVVLTFSISPT